MWHKTCHAMAARDVPYDQDWLCILWGNYSTRFYAGAYGNLPSITLLSY
jgi:hypothetical protein